jgi:Fe-S cluster biogenesis protein NfuA
MADLKSRVAARLAAITPYLERSGASAELVGVEDGVAQLRVMLTRPGSSRLVASLQLKNGIERALRDSIPELRAVEAINLPPHTLVGWDQDPVTPLEPLKP